MCRGLTNGEEPSVQVSALLPFRQESVVKTFWRKRIVQLLNGLLTDLFVVTLCLLNRTAGTTGIKHYFGVKGGAVLEGGALISRVVYPKYC